MCRTVRFYDANIIQHYCNIFLDWQYMATEAHGLFQILRNNLLGHKASQSTQILLENVCGFCFTAAVLMQWLYYCHSYKHFASLWQCSASVPSVIRFQSQRETTIIFLLFISKLQQYFSLCWNLNPAFIAKGDFWRTCNISHSLRQQKLNPRST